MSAQPRLAADGNACKHVVPLRLKPGVRHCTLTDRMEGRHGNR